MTQAPSILNRTSSFLQVTRKPLNEFNFGQITSPFIELPALERLKS